MDYHTITWIIPLSSTHQTCVEHSLSHCGFHRFDHRLHRVPVALGGSRRAGTGRGRGLRFNLGKGWESADFDGKNWFCWENLQETSRKHGFYQQILGFPVRNNHQFYDFYGKKQGFQRGKQHETT